jgi:hypothetical protein
MMSRSLVFVLAVLALYLPVASASYHGPKKFDFLPVQSQKQFSGLNINTCNATYALYTAAYEASDNWVLLAGTCGKHQRCLLENTDENAKAYISSSALLIGFTPMLLSNVAPTISELGLISLNRPILSILLSMGTAAVYPTRVMSYSDDALQDILTKDPMFPAAIVGAIQNQRWLRNMISVTQYFLVMAAVVNIISTAWELGKGTVLTFQCQISYIPVLWTLFPLVIRIPSTLALRFSARRANRLSILYPDVSRAATTGFWAKETALSFMHDPLQDELLGPNITASLLLIIAGSLAFVHAIFGILLFSSLLFGMIMDILVMLLRFLASVLVCRAVILLELQGMRWVAFKDREERRQNSNEMQEENQVSISFGKTCHY